jgi:putative pyruvate formate lyase activating enzyme
MNTPSYLALFETGELYERAVQARQHLQRCDLCGWECRADRLAGVLGVCRTGELACVSSFGPHLGEEHVLSGWHGSGAIFFARCNMRCQYCQNHEISQSEAGDPLQPEQLAAIMLELQARGCHNVNLVSPSHVVAPILAALVVAVGRGLRLPLVYNSGGYDSPAALQLLDDVIDIYLPDMKYASQQIGRAYSKTPRYPQINRAAVKEMQRQVGDLHVDEHGLAQRGLLVRCLALPNGLAGVADTARFLADEVSQNTAINLMDQYRPEYNVLRYPNQFPKLKRTLTRQEYQDAVAMVHTAGLNPLSE